MNDAHYLAWMKQEHVSIFDQKKYYLSFFLKKNFENFNEIYLLRKTQDNKSRFSLLEIGCATGEFYRYFKYIYPQMEYDGFDISQKAIEEARVKFPKGRFYVNTVNDLSKMRAVHPDWIFCRDVVLHQEQPFEFIQNLCEISQKYILLRIRTRDVGETVLDPSLSCQFNYGLWTPYIILNCDELVTSLSANCPDINEIIFMKHYMVLGGQELRFLPKECYEPKTKTAETAILIKKGPRKLGKLVVTSLKNEEKRQRQIVGKIAAELMRAIMVRSSVRKIFW